jgi:hypothetical protein
VFISLIAYSRCKFYLILAHVRQLDEVEDAEDDFEEISPPQINKRSLVAK